MDEGVVEEIELGRWVVDGWWMGEWVDTNRTEPTEPTETCRNLPKPTFGAPCTIARYLPSAPRRSSLPLPPLRPSESHLAPEAT